MTKKFYAAIENPPAATATYLLFRRVIRDSVKARRWETLGNCCDIASAKIWHYERVKSVRLKKTAH